LGVTNRDVAILAFRLLALWLVANAVISVSAIPYFWESQPSELRSITVFFTLLPALVSLGIGVPLWFSADWLAGRTFPAALREQIEPDKLRTERLLTLALSVLGVLFVCEALPGIVNGLALFTQSRSLGRSVLGPDEAQARLLWNAAAKANFAGTVARLVIGACLLAGPTRLASVIARVRSDLVGTLAEQAAEEQKAQGAVEQALGADETRRVL
jgi:hypothetical protein